MFYGVSTGRDAGPVQAASTASKHVDIPAAPASGYGGDPLDAVVVWRIRRPPGSHVHPLWTPSVSMSDAFKRSAPADQRRFDETHVVTRH